VHIIGYQLIFAWVSVIYVHAHVYIHHDIYKMLEKDWSFKIIYVFIRRYAVYTLHIPFPSKAKKKNTFVSCCPTDPNFLVPTLNFFRDF